MRRALGLALLVTGALIVGHAGSTWASGALARDRARAAWDAEQARLAVDSLRLAISSMTRTAGPPPLGAPVARLRIPSVRLDEIVVEGVGVSQLNAGPGHVPGSPLPGARGNSVISAHRDRHFRALDEIAIGDIIETESRQQRVTWVVRDVQVVGADTPALFSASEPTLTLTTCWPVRFFGPSPDRLIITATPS